MASPSAADVKQEEAAAAEPGALLSAETVKHENEEQGQTMAQQLDDGVKPATKLTEDNFKQVTRGAVDHYLSKFGGPVQYLKWHLGEVSNSKWTDFAHQLCTAFPRRPHLTYLDQNSSQLPRSSDPTHTFKVSLWQLGFLDVCSTKPPKFKVTCAALTDEYVTNTCLTAGEPLLLYQQSDPLPAEFQCANQNQDPVFFTHYVKGAARATSMLMLAHVLLNKLQADVQLLHPDLHASMCAVYCRVAMTVCDTTSVALENARFSARGAIRKAHDVITWAGKVHGLRAQGLAPSEIIKKFNESATKEAAIMGAKRAALLQLLELPENCLSLLIKHISDFSFEGSAFTETVFSNKKLMPGYQPRANNDKAWQQRLRITPAGYELFITYVDAAHNRKPPGARGKMDTAALTSELAKAFQPADLTPFKSIIATCIAKRDGKMQALGKGGKICAGQLEKQAFELLLSSLQHDADSYAVWKAKCTDRESALYFQKLSHKTARHSRAREMADSVFADERGPGWMMTLARWESKDAMNVSLWNEVCSHITRQCQLPDAKHIRCLCVLNWAAPSVFSGATQNKQSMLLGAIVNSGSKSTGVALTPSYF
eukprot:s119_g65.t1